MSLISLHDGLWSHSRVPLVRQSSGSASLAEWIALLSLGAAAAALTELIDFSLRLPGHAILRSIFPLALGLALAPRRMAGTIMGLGALGSAAVIRLGGLGGGLGSLTSVCLLGPLLDAALLRARSGAWIYGGMALGASAANMAAFSVQFAVKLAASGGGGGGGGMGGGRGLASWLPVASLTYPLFGILAGLVSAAIWFRFREGRSSAPPPKPHG